jgi:hypothetical protein
VCGCWSMVVHDDIGVDQGSFDRFDLRLTCAADGRIAQVNPPPVAPPPVEDPTAPPQPRQPAQPQQPAQPRLPEFPAHADIVAVLAQLRPGIGQRCSQAGGNVRLYFTINGSSGSVSGRPSASGTASDAEQACVTQAVRGARFPRFRRASLDVDYTYDLPARPQGGNALPNSPSVQF